MDLVKAITQLQEELKTTREELKTTREELAEVKRANAVRGERPTESLTPKLKDELLHSSAICPI